MKKILFIIISCFVFSFAGLINSGDKLSILIPNNTALSKTVEVEKDGTVNYPLLIGKNVSGMTINELTDHLQLSLAKMDLNSMVLVSPAIDTIMVINVLGQVVKPGIVLIPYGATLQEALVAAGGITDFSDLKKIRLFRKGADTRDPVIVDMQKFLYEGDISVLPELKTGDMIVVPSRPSSRKIKVLGAVKSPGFYTPYPDASVFDLIQVAGGQLEDSDLSKVKHITNSNGKDLENIVDVQNYWDNHAQADSLPIVKEGDVIIVYKKTFTRQKVIALLRDIVTVLTATLLIYNISISGSN